MEPGSTKLLFVVLFVLIILSAVFSAAETALMSVSKIRLRAIDDEKSEKAERILKLLENPNRLLSTILVGNNIVNIGASSIATAIAISYDPVSGVGIATILMTLIILIFGEITPKTLAAQNSERVALGMVNFISALVKVFSPFIVVLNVVTGLLVKLFGGKDIEKMPTITEAELKTMVDVSHEEGVLEKDERQMINNVFDFGDSKAKDVMTPRTDMVAIDINADIDEVTEIYKEERFSRLPVYAETIDDIVGILHLKDIAFIQKEGFSVEKYMRDPFFTYESKGISELFRQMKTNRIPVAIVLDEYGGTSGLVTVEDMVEEIVGEIADEYDEMEEEIRKISEHEYIANGSTRIDDVNEILFMSIESDDFETIGGYVIGILGRFPQKGEVIETDGVKITIEQVDKNRIETLKIEILDK